MLELRSLGTLSASTASPDGVRQLARGKPVALLAYLCAAPGRRASRERLATLLWSDGTSEQARQNLRQTVWYLRRRLGAVIEASEDFLVISGDVSADRETFLAAVREQRLADALRLYEGDFIPDFAAPGAAEFEEWCDVERRRLRALFIGCTDTLARQALSRGQAASAADLARRARDVAPYDLAPWRLLLEALVAARDPVAALAEAESLDALLAAQEMEADDATRAALRSARNAANAGRSVTSTAGAASGTSPDEHANFSPEMIGREAEFSALLERWEQARAGRGSAVLITGVAGLGKSRLLADLHARLRAGRARAVLIRANPGDRAVAGGFAAALAETVAQRPGSAGISAESAGVLVALAPALASVYTQASPDRSTGDDAQRRRVSAILELLRAVSEDAALALLVDDLHWADLESRRLLDAVAARLEGGRVLLVLAARPPIESLGGFSGLPRVELARLDLARVAEFITRLGELPAEPWAADLPSQLASATRGIPLTIVEALQRLIEEGSLTLREHHWSSTAPARIVEVLRAGAVLENRVRSLSPGPRELLLLLATLGRPASATAVGADSRLTELEQRGFVARVDGELQVVHDELADAAMAVATDDERETAHARAAAILAADAGSDGSLMLAARHAASGMATDLLRSLAARWVESKRAAGRRDSAKVLLQELLGVEARPSTSSLALAGVAFVQRPARVVWNAAAAILIAVASLGGWTAMTSAGEPDVEYIVQMEGAELRYARVSIPDVSDWDADQPVEAELLRASELPSYLADVSGRMRLFSLPDGSGLMGLAFFADSGGDEIVFVDEGGEVQRPVSAKGDDGGWASSPDGRYFAFATARYNPSTDLYQIAVYDRVNRTLRRLTTNNDFDASPAWSPDGTRLAFMRNPFSKVGPSKICVIHVDGSDERCEWPGLNESLSLKGWVDDERLLVEEIFPSRNFVYNTETYDREVAPNGQVWDSPDARVVLVASRQSGDGLAVERTDLRGAERRVMLDGKPLVGIPRITRGALIRRQRFVDSVALNLPTGGLAVDLTHRLLAEAFDSAGRQVKAHAVRLRPLDPSIARIDGNQLRPLRTGDLQIEVSLGGWRTDTVSVRILPSSAREVISENWERGFGGRWRPFGNPEATLGRSARFATLRPNGDGKYNSGVYLVDSVPLESGLGLETSISIPVNRLQWQNVVVGLVGEPTRASLTAWDHRTGDGPLGSSIVCAVAFGGDGGSAFTHYILSGHNGEAVREPAPATLFTGRWHRLRLQYFPDGRCGVALDDRPTLVTRGEIRQTGSAILRITGHSVGTNVQVGPLKLWTGVLGGVDWARAGSR